MTDRIVPIESHNGALDLEGRRTALDFIAPLWQRRCAIILRYPSKCFSAPGLQNRGRCSFAAQKGRRRNFGLFAGRSRLLAFIKSTETRWIFILPAPWPWHFRRRNEGRRSAPEAQ